MIKNSVLIPPYGGKLVNLVTTGEEREALREQANHYPSIQISDRALHDLELLAIGGYSPLDRFMCKADYQRVLTEMRLADGTLFPMPITLTIKKEDLPTNSEWVAIRDSRLNLIAVMNMEEVFTWDPAREQRLVLGSTDSRHPLVSEMEQWGDLCISGEFKVINLPVYYDFVDIRRTPVETRLLLEEMGNENVVAFQTRNPMHRIHEELTKRAAEEVGGSLLIHPVVGMTKPGDVDHFTRVRVYKALVENYYPKDRTVLSLLPLAMRMAGPREAVWHAIIRRNYGVNHFIVGRDHAGPGNDSAGNPFYGPYEAQEMMKQYEDEIGVKMVPFLLMVYLPDNEEYVPIDKVPEGAKVNTISGTQVRQDYLAKGKLLPEWFTRNETAEILAEVHPPKRKQGLCLWFTGLSGCGKSTIASALIPMLMEHGRQATVLDGDVVRTHLSKGLGFSKEDRDINILRIGYVAGEIARHNGTVVCAAISPYRNTRNEARKMSGDDRFVEIFVNTPLEVCEERDIKGLYAMARRGEIKGFTGIDDPYEAPKNAEITLNTVNNTPEELARQIISYLQEQDLSARLMARLPKLFDLTDRVAIVTGGVGLLGAEFCRTLAEAGAAVTIADLNGKAARNLAASLTQFGYRAFGHTTDVTSPDSVKEMVTATLDAYGRLDILVNSAALDPKFDPQSQKSHSGAFECYPVELWQQALDVNLTGAMLCCQAAVRPMLGQGGGTIINLCSIYGVSAPDQRLYQRDGQPAQFKPVYYTVTKAGVLGLTKYLAAYYGEENIRVNALTPGGVYNEHDNEFLKAYAARSMMGRMAEKDEMNGALLFLASDASRYMTGANLIVDGGWTSW